MSDFYTFADLRRLTGQPGHVLKYAIERHGPEPCSRAGLVRLWSKDDLPAVRESLKKTAAHSTLPGRRVEAVR